EKTYHGSSMLYVNRVYGQLTEHIEKHRTGEGDITKDNVESQPEDVRACWKLREEMNGGYVNEKNEKGEPVRVYRSPLSPAQVGTRVNEILEKNEEAREKGETKVTVHLTPAIPFGNLWSSCYFAMTGFHALHVLGGLVIFAIILVIGLR